MVSGRRRGPSKNARGVSDFIGDQLVILVNIARTLNGEMPRAEREGRPEWVAQEQKAREQAAAVVDTALGARYPTIPPAAAAAFDALAAEQPIQFTVRHSNLRGPWVIQPDYRVPIRLVGRSAQGVMAVWLAGYFANPQRDRLRRCEQCRRWYVDETRNKSSRRCSRACTIRWSNAQRKERSR
jgi:predicted RNA-binding Zn ribbon-like protein